MDSFDTIRNFVFPIVKVVEATSDAVNTSLEFSKGKEPIHKQIVGDLFVFCGIDRTSHFELVTLDYLSAEMTIDTLIDIAVDNLEKELDGKIKLSDTTFGAKMLTCGGNFEASLLLVHSVWEGVFEQLGDDLIVAFPAKDLAFCVSASDVAAITALKQVIEEVHKEGEQLLSKQLFRKTKDNLEVYLPLPTIA